MVSPKSRALRFFRFLRFPALMLVALASAAHGQSPGTIVGTVGQPLQYQIPAFGSPTNYVAANLPAGFLPPNSNGLIAALPQVSGSYTSTVTVQTASTNVTNQLFITVNPPAVPELVSPPTVFGMRGEPLLYPLLSAPNHSNVPTTFSVTNLPFGMSVFSNVTTNAGYSNVLVTNYFLQGTLLTNGSYVVPVVTRNNGGNQVTTNNVTFVIEEERAPVITSPAAASAIQGVPFSFDITAINSPQRIEASTNGGATWPTNRPVNIGNGLQFTEVQSGSTVFGRITGTPGNTNPVVVDLRALNGAGSDQQTLTITVGPPRPTVIITQPLSEGRFVQGSSFFLNAQAFNRPEGTIIESSQGFRVVGQAAPIPGAIGRLGDFFGVEYYPDQATYPPVTRRIEAFARTTLSPFETTSFPFEMRAHAPDNALPLVNMLPLFPGPALQAGGTVTLRASATLPSTRVNIDRVEFYVNKVFVGATTAPVAGSADEYQFVWTTPDTPGSFEVSARAVSLNYIFNIEFAGVRESYAVYASTITRRPVILNTIQGVLPTVSITSPANGAELRLRDPAAPPYLIRAAASVAGGNITQVRFFANGLEIPADPDFPSPDLTEPFEVAFRPTSSGTYELFAIATSSGGLQNISPTVIVTVVGEPTVPGGLDPATNAGFVVEMYNSLLYRPPTYNEWVSYLNQLNAGTINRAGVVMAIMGYNPLTESFNRNNEYWSRSGAAFLLYGRLGLAPTIGEIDAFNNTVASDVNPLPIVSPYSGLNGSPYGATFGMAQAVQDVFAGPAFSRKFPTATALPNGQFLGWLNTVMFPGLYPGIEEARILEMMETINPQAIAQGAAAAFRQQFSLAVAAAGIEPWAGVENLTQRQIATTVLNYQLSKSNPAEWDSSFGQANPYGMVVVNNLLYDYGYETTLMTGSELSGFGAKASYQGIASQVGDSIFSSRSAGEAAATTSTATGSEMLPPATTIQGGLKVRVRPSGSYTASLNLAKGVVYRARGKVSPGGRIVGTWTSKAGAPIDVSLRPALQEGAEYLGGVILVGSTPLEVMAGRQIFGARNRFPVPNRQTLVLRPPTGTPAGHGSATARINAAGSARLAGHLPDGSKFTSSVPVWGGLSEQASILIYQPLYRGQGALRGWIKGKVSSSALTGDFGWQLGVANAQGSTDVPLSTEINLFAPTTAQGSVFPAAWPAISPVAMRVSGVSPVQGALFADPRGRLAGLNGFPMMLKVNPRTGAVTGQSTVGSLTGRVYGVMNQKNLRIDGQIVLPQTTGVVEVNAPPTAGGK